MDLKLIITFVSFGVVLLGVLLFVYGVEIIKHKDDKHSKPQSH